MSELGCIDVISVEPKAKVNGYRPSLPRRVVDTGTASSDLQRFVFQQNKSVFSFLRQLTTYHSLFAVAADRRAAVRRAAGRPAAAGVDRYLLPAANPPHAAAAVDRRDKRTDRRTIGQTDTVPLHRPYRIPTDCIRDIEQRSFASPRLK